MKPGDEAAEGFAVDVAECGDTALGQALAQHFFNRDAFMIEFELGFFGDGAGGTAETDALRATACKGLAGTLADEVALDLRGKAECECQDLAWDVVTEAVAVLDGPHAAAFRHADVQYFHDHEEIAPETRKFRADDEVAAAHTAQKSSEKPFAVGLGAAYGLLDPAVDGNALPLAETDNLKPLVLNGLFVAADPDVSVIHNSPSSVLPIVGHILAHPVQCKYRRTCGIIAYARHNS